MSFRFAGYRLPALAIAGVLALSGAPLQAQQQPQQGQEVKPGTEATGAMGTQVETMKPDCPPTTATGERQQQHPPTAGLSEKVPTMTAQEDCPEPSAPAGGQQRQ